MFHCSLPVPFGGFVFMPVEMPRVVSHAKLGSSQRGHDASVHFGVGHAMVSPYLCQEPNFINTFEKSIFHLTRNGFRSILNLRDKCCRLLRLVDIQC